MPSARVFGPWPEHSNPAASCSQWSCALQAEAVDTFFFFACAHLTRGRCCTSDLIAPCNRQSTRLALGDSNDSVASVIEGLEHPCIVRIGLKPKIVLQRFTRHCAFHDATGNDYVEAHRMSAVSDDRLS